MTEQEALQYVRLVHDRVDGKHITKKKGESISKFLGRQFDHAMTDAKMPEYDHAKYVKANHILSIHGDDVLEPGAALMEIFRDIKSFFKGLFK